MSAEEPDPAGSSTSTRTSTRARTIAIAELREAAGELLSELGERGEAMMLVTTGVVAVHGRYADLSTAMDRVSSGDVDEHVLRLLYAPSHEAVHMLQLLTSRFVLHLAFELFNVAIVTHRHRHAGTAPAQWLPAVLQDYHRARTALTESADAGFSALQVMEAQAVLEGFRGGYSRHVRDGLRLVMQRAHGDDPLYTALITTVDALHGHALTFEVLPRLCWLALNETAPGRWMTQALATLKTADLQHIAALSASDTCRAFGRDPTELGQSWRRRQAGIRDHLLHGLLGRYFDAIERETDAERYLQRAMHPGRTPPGAAVDMAALLPPLAIYTDGVFVLNGPYRDDGWAAAEPLVRMSALLLRSLSWLDGQIEASR